MPKKKIIKKEASPETSVSTIPNTANGVKAPFTEAQVKLIKNTVAKGATDDELKLFLVVANKSGLDPFSKQIHFVKRKDKTGNYVGAIQTGIDGYRAVAERSGEYAGSDDIEYGEVEKNKPEWARATVYKIVKGVRVPFIATARWKEFVPPAPNDFMWNKMPFHMLGKVAEALALRKAFPNDLSGIYVEDEMEHVGTVVDAKDVTITKEKPIEVSAKAVEEVKTSPLEPLFATAREFGAKKGEESIFIQQNLDTDVNWEALDEKAAAHLRTRLMSKLTQRV